MLRYESAAFFDQSTLPGNTQVCNGSAVEAAGFADAARALVADLAAAVPRVPGLAAAAASGGVYAAAQCVETVGEGGCAQCLNVAVANIDGCPPNSDGRAVDAGCFMRYSDKSFFPANSTVDLAVYLRSGEFIFVYVSCVFAWVINLGFHVVDTGCSVLLGQVLLVLYTGPCSPMFLTRTSSIMD
jgi:hypothetical protein